MKKTTKTLAAMLAAVMTVSALGSMSAFAITDVTSNHYTEGGETKSATVDLQAKVTDGDNTETDGSFNEENVDTGKHIWNVTISADTLKWDLVKNTTTTYYQTLTWDATNHKYTAARATGDGSVQSTAAQYEVASPDTADKTVNVQNDSNFAITSATNIATEATAKGATFTAVDPQGNIAIGANADTTITIDTSGMANQGFDSADYVSVGTATITLTAVENSIAEYTPTP